MKNKNEWFEKFNSKKMPDGSQRTNTIKNMTFEFAVPTSTFRLVIIAISYYCNTTIEYTAYTESVSVFRSLWFIVYALLEFAVNWSSRSGFS